jgi:hypothetical protein
MPGRDGSGGDRGPRAGGGDRPPDMGRGGRGSRGDDRPR